MNRTPSLAMAALLIALVPRAASPQAGDFALKKPDQRHASRDSKRSGDLRRRRQAYIDRAKAYNGTCTALVTKDGAPIPAATGSVRAGVPLTFPITTVPVSSVLPNFDQYAGPSMEFGRMEPTLSDPSVQQQFGMRVGLPNAGQVNALSTLNIRGERSVTCKGDFDKAPSAGPLPPGAPKVCEEFRRLPDALERAVELDKQYGRRPDLEKLPMYCVAFSWKSWYDAKDMRATGGNDVNFAMDAPALDSTDVADVRRRAPSALLSRTRAQPAALRQAGAAGAGRTRTRHRCCSKPTPRTAYGAGSRAIRTTRSACREARAPAPAYPLPRISSPARCASRPPHRARDRHHAITW